MVLISSAKRSKLKSVHSSRTIPPEMGSCLPNEIYSPFGPSSVSRITSQFQFGSQPISIFAAEGTPPHCGRSVLWQSSVYPVGPCQNASSQVGGVLEA